MQETERPDRRLHRHERKLLRRIELVVPIALVIGAVLLSMGVIRVMEVSTPRPVYKPVAKEEQRSELDPLGLAPARSDPDMPDMLGVSLLELEGQSGRQR